MLFAIDNKLGFLIALLAGTVAAAAAVIFAKQFAKPSVKVEDSPVLAAA